MSKRIKILLTFITIVIIIIPTVLLIHNLDRGDQVFDGQRALSDVKYQVELGPRTMGSLAHEQAVRWITNKLKDTSWSVEIQETVIAGQTIKNIIAKRGTGSPWIIIGSHYDSRAFADRDPDRANRKLPVPGANDGASSTAVLLELSRVLPTNLNKQVWLVFFDDEDNGTASGSGWSIGSKYFVSQLRGIPDSVVVLDMVGDKNLNIYMEGNSNPEINKEIWAVAKELGYSQFIPRYNTDVTDDHIPFIKAGIKAVDIIDIDYPYWHTTQDTIDKISAESLKVVGDTVIKWLDEYPATVIPTR